MRVFSRTAAGLALAAMLASTATPALADRGWGGGWNRGGWDRGGWNDRYRRRDNGVATAIGVAALIGAVAIVASSAAKDRRAAQARNAPPPPDPRYEDGNAAAMPAGSEDAAVDACALAARDEGSRDGSYAEVREITGTKPWEGGWAVDGTLDQRQGFRGPGITRRFSCSWRDGQIGDVILSRDSIALN